MFKTEHLWHYQKTEKANSLVVERRVISVMIKNTLQAPTRMYEFLEMAKSFKIFLLL